MPHIHDLYDFTVSGFILHPFEPKICLHKHKKLGVWLQPGGHIELNEDPLEALNHELREEVGLSADSYHIIERIDQPGSRGAKILPLPFNLNVHDYNDTHKHIDLSYLIRATHETLQPEAGESDQIDWFSLQEIENLHNEGTMFDGTYDICLWIFNNVM